MILLTMAVTLIALVRVVGVEKSFMVVVDMFINKKNFFSSG